MVYHLTLGPLGTNCYILTDENNVGVIFDPAASGTKIMELLNEKKIDLKAIFLTHGHYDHIGAVGYLMENISGLSCYMNEREFLLTDRYKSGESLPAYLKKVDYEGFKTTHNIDDCDIIKVGNLEIKAISTPGHTKGSLIFISEGIMFTGDTLFKGSMGRCDLLGGDEEVMMKSLKKLYDYEGDFSVCPGHEGATKLSEERKTNPYMRMAIK